MKILPFWPKGLLLLLFVLGAGAGLWRLYNAGVYGDDEIVLGQSCALSGPSAELGHGMMIGANAWFSHINASGGVGGRKIRLITLDDSYEPRLTEANTKKLIEAEKIFALFGYVGTPTAQAVLPLIEAHGVPFVAPLTGAGFLRNPPHPWVVNLRAGYEAEIELLSEHLKEKGVARVAVFYQNDSYGKTGLYAARKVLGRQKLQLVAEGAYSRNTLSVGHALYEIAPQKPQAIIMIDAYQPGAEFIRRARKEGLTETIFAHVSFVNSDSLAAELGAEGMQNVLVSQVVPPPWDNSFEEVLEYQSIMARYYPHATLTFASLEGFLAARAVASALQDQKGRLTRRGFVDSLLQRVERGPGAGVWITAYRDGRMRVVRRDRP